MKSSLVTFTLCALCMVACSGQSDIGSKSSGTKNVPVNGQLEIVKPDPSTQLRVLQDYGKLPLAFEENRGQVDPRVKFVSRGAGYTLFLTADEAVLSVAEKVAKNQRPGANRSSTDSHLSSRESEQPARNVNLSMKLVGSDPHATVSGVDQLPGESNFFIGNDPKKWHTNLPNYAKVNYAGVYPGVGLIYYGNQGKLEYDFVVAPGADLRRIQFDVRGTKRIRRDGDGDLVLKMEMGEDEIRWHKPVAYQEKNGTRQLVAAHYAITNANRVGFKVEEYDASMPLYIDPVIYSTYLGGSGEDDGYGIAVDSSGNAYVTGETGSTDFPTTASAFQKTCSDCSTGSAFVTKINPTGSALVYSTYLGGSGGGSGNPGDAGLGIAVDSSGNAYVTGQTASSDFPTTPGAFQKVCGGGSNCTVYNDGFVTKLNPTGSALVYSTYLGGSSYDEPWGIAVDSSGNAYVTGFTQSTDFPTKNALQPQLGSSLLNAFVTKLNASGSALVYSTYLGGNGGDYAYSIAVDSSGNAYVTGQTASSDFPTTPGAFQTVCNGGSGCAPNTDAFVTKINASGSALVYSTYLGGNGDDDGFGIAVDSSGNAYVTGMTASTNFPTTPGAFQTVCNACATNLHLFVTKLNLTGSALVYSTYLGGTGFEQTPTIAVDSSGNAYVTGDTGSTDFPTTSGAFQTVCNGGSGCADYFDAFLTKFNPTGSALIYSTYLGGSGADEGQGIAVDSSGNAYVTGGTASTDFPTTTGAFQTVCNGCSTDGTAFVVKFALGSTQPGPAANVTPANLNFGSLVIGTESGAKTVTLSNDGGAALAISSIDVTGTNSSDFNQTNNCGTSLAANASCTISVTFTPSATGARIASLVITDNAANSPQTVSLTGTGAAGTTSATLSPTSLTFSGQVVGSSSTTQAITLTNGGNAPLSVTSIAVTGANNADFTQTDTCGNSVAASGSCTINVTFKPSATGTRSASVTVTDNAANSPQTVPATGSGTDFSFGVANGGSNTATVSAGNKATYNLQVTPMNGFSGAVALSCSGAPSEATCTISPSSMTLNGAAGAFTVSVSTTSSSIVTPQFRPDRRHGPKVAPLCLLLALVGFFLLTGFRNSTSGFRKRFAYIPALAALILVLVWAGGCSGINTVHTHNAGTPTGTYTLMITGTSSGATRTQSLTLTVQ